MINEQVDGEGLNINPTLLEGLPSRAIEILRLTYDENDKIYDVQLSDQTMIVTVNQGNVGTKTIEDRFSL